MKCVIAVLFFYQAVFGQVDNSGNSVAPGKRALLIANSGYQHLPPLRSPNANVAALATTLSKVRIQPEVKYDLSYSAMVEAIERFVVGIAPGDFALVFFSGYGFQIDEINYLLPTTFDPGDDSTIGAKAFAVRNLLAQLDKRKAGTRMLILDAGRSGPGLPEGLAAMAPPPITLISFSSAPNKYAPDPPDGGINSFTAALIRAIEKPGSTPGNILLRAQLEVDQASEGLQMPFVVGKSATNFFFTERLQPALLPAPGPPPEPIKENPRPPTPSFDPAAEAYAAVRDSGNPELLLQFAEAFPKSPLAEEARRKAEAIRVEKNPGVTSPTTTRPAGEERKNPKDDQTYVWIPPGRFQMGCSEGDSDCEDNEKPAHEVTLSKGFWLGQTEVTVGAWRRYRTATGKDPLQTKDELGRKNLNEKSKTDNVPAVLMKWREASDFCGWAGGRLPAEAEWEYAARAGSKASRYGDAGAVAWYGDNSGDSPIDSEQFAKTHGVTYGRRLYENGNGPHAVALKERNAWKLYDMLGNVSEWVADWYGQDSYPTAAMTDPEGPKTGKSRTVRGGSFASFPMEVRASARTGEQPGTSGSNVGLRCAWDGR